MAAEQSGCEIRRLRGVGNSTEVCVQAPLDHRLSDRHGRAAPARRGGMDQEVNPSD